MNFKILYLFNTQFNFRQRHRQSIFRSTFFNRLIFYEKQNRLKERKKERKKGRKKERKEHIDFKEACTRESERKRFAELK